MSRAFWEDEDDDAAGDPWSQLSQLSQSQSQSSQGAAAAGGAHDHSQQQSQFSQSQSQQSGSVYLSQQFQVAFCCDNCGNTGDDYYTDDATGRDVCGQCFAQQSSTQDRDAGADDTADHDDVWAVAARTRAGGLQQRQWFAGGGGGSSHRAKQPLQEVDRSRPLPDVQLCLRGMQCLLQRCVELAVRELVALEETTVRLVQDGADEISPKDNKSDDDVNRSSNDDDSDNESFAEAQPPEFPLLFNDKNISDDASTSPQQQQQQQQQYERAARRTVEALWRAYLRAWADGAEHYGALYPHVRFCFRDLFLADVHASRLVRRQLVHQAALQLDGGGAAARRGVKEEGIDNDFGEEIFEDEHENEDIFEPFAQLKRVASSNDDKLMETEEDANTTNLDDPGVIRLSAVRKIIRAHCAEQKQMKGYREAALYLRPSVRMVAALVWMSLTKTCGSDDGSGKTATLPPVTSHQFCHWVNTGRLPLQSAFSSLLSFKLQERLAAVGALFRLDKPLLPCELETEAENLCVACRLRVTPKRRTTREEEEDEDDVESIDSDRRRRRRRLKEQETVPPAVVNRHGKRQRVRFWSVADVPRILAQLVANAGLDQGVLDRSLVMADFALDQEMACSSGSMRLRRTDPREEWQRRIDIMKAKQERERKEREEFKERHGKRMYKKRSAAYRLDLLELPQLVNPEDLSCVEEMLAVIAISCQLDPQWRTWKYVIPPQQQRMVPSPPWNETQFRLLTNGPSMESYLSFCEQVVFPGGDDNASTGRRFTMLPDEYFDAVGGPSLNIKDSNASSTAVVDDDQEAAVHSTVQQPVRPCTVLAGAELQGHVDITNRTHHSLKGRRLNDTTDKASAEPKSSLVARARRSENAPDPTFVLPKFDFRKAQRAASRRVPAGSQDADQARLVEALALTAGADPVRIQNAVNSILERKPFFA